MFTSIEEGLQVYKNAVKDYLNKCREIGGAEKRERQADGRDYYGSLDWSKKDWGWKQTTEHIVHGMATALGFSKEEIDNIWEGIEKSL